MRGVGGLWRDAVRSIKEQFQMPGPNMVLNREVVVVRPDKSRLLADVMLYPDAQQALTPTWHGPPPEFSEIFVLLAEVDDGHERCVEICISGDRLGALTVADSADFLPILARAKDQPVAAQATRDRDADGAWALHLYRPEHR